MRRPYASSYLNNATIRHLWDYLITNYALQCEAGMSFMSGVLKCLLSVCGVLDFQCIFGVFVFLLR